MNKDSINRRSFLKSLTAGIITAGTPASVLAEIITLKTHKTPDEYESHIKDYLHKMHDFNSHHKNDTRLNTTQRPLLKSSLDRFKRLQRTVGYGNFHLLSLDEAVKI